MIETKLTNRNDNYNNIANINNIFEGASCVAILNTGEKKYFKSRKAAAKFFYIKYVSAIIKYIQSVKKNKKGLKTKLHGRVIFRDATKQEIYDNSNVKA